MEANLNQFRLLTMAGEEKAGNDRRRTGARETGTRGNGSPFDQKGCQGDGKGKASQFGRDGAGKGSQYDRQTDPCNDQMEGGLMSPISRDGETPSSQGEKDSRRQSAEVDSVSSGGRQSDFQGETSSPWGAATQGHNPPDYSSHMATGSVARKNDDEDDGLVLGGEIDMDGNVESQSGGGDGSLVGAIRSLERTISNHCQLLNKKLRRDRTMKMPSEGTRIPAILKTPALRSDKVIVYIRVVFLKIGEIDTMKENFMADAFIQARWREPALDGQAAQFQSLQNIEDIDWDKFWNPKLYVENNLGEPKETVWQTLMFNAKGDATVYERRRIKGCFLENLELDEFPFDTQDLTLTISTERSETELELEEDSSEISSINVQSFVDEQEWKLHSHVETRRRVTTKIYQNSKFKHPAFSTSCRASRRPGFFIWNIFLVMLFICSLTFATFSVELTKPENRLQLSFILLLTTITFKFVVSQTLPRISYLTYLDKYILTSMGILCGVCVWHAIIPLFKTDEASLIKAKKIDMWALIVCGSSYFLFHVCFFMYIYFVAMKKRWTYDQKDRDHRERVKKLQRLQELANLPHTDTNSIPPSASMARVESV